MSDDNELELVEVEKGNFVTREEAQRLYRLNPKPRRPLFPPGTLDHIIQLIGVAIFVALIAPFVHAVTDPMVDKVFEAVGVSPNKHRQPYHP